jgi:hypothetical protein
MNRRLTISLFLAIAFAAACAVQGRPFEKAKASPGNAIIYVYRPYKFESSLLKPPVTCGDQSAEIGPGGYHAFVVPAGQTVECSVKTETIDQVEIHAEPHAYYFKEDFGWGVLRGHPHLNPADADEAQTEIQNCCVLEK